MRKISGWLFLLMLASCAGVGSTSFTKGGELFTAGDYDQAVMAYATAVEQNPAKDEYRMRLQLARHRAALYHVTRADELMNRKEYQQALEEYQLATGLDGSIESGRAGAAQAKRYLKVAGQVKEARKMLRDRHFKQARTLVSEALDILPEYGPARDLKKELDSHASTMIDGVELEVTSNEPITLNFKAASLPDVFDILTQLSGIRFILDEEIRSQTTTLYLEDATFAQAFELLLRMNKLDKKILNSRTIILFSNTKNKKKQFSDQIIQTFYLSNIDAKKAVNLLRTMLQVRKIYVHEELNAIVLRDKPEVIRLAQKIIEANDRATSEVVFDLELVEVSHTKDLALGPKLSSYSLGVGLSDPANPATTVGAITAGTLNNLKFLYNVPSATFDLKKQRGDAEILASPKIRVKNKGKAKVHIGSREPVVTVTTSGANGEQKSDSVQYVDVGVKLDVEPVIQLDNTIVTKIGLEVSNVSDRKTINQGTTVLTISTTNANTELILKDGEQTIIGGLLRDDESKTKTGIPILSDIPLLGSLFTNYVTNKTKREILLSITPHIVRAVRLPEGTSATIWSGGEDDLRTGRNFGSFADEYVEGQGKTLPRSVPALQKTTPQAGQPQALDVQPQAVPETPTPVTPAVVPVSQKKPATNSAVVTTPPQTAKKSVSQPVVADTGKVVPEVVLAGLKSPEAITRPTIFLEGDRLARVGQNFSVTLRVQDVKSLFSAPLYIRFDPKLVEFVSASEGTFFKKNGGQSIFTSTLMANSGRLILGLKQGTGGRGVSGGGLLARLVFKARATGKLSIAPERVNFRNPAGERLAIDSRGLIVEVQ